MASEGYLSVQLRAEKGFFKSDRSLTYNFDLATARKSATVQAIGTTAEQVQVSTDIATAGHAWIRNLDTAKTIEVSVTDDGGTTVVPFAKLLPGYVAIVPLYSTTIYARNAGAGTADLELDVFSA